MNRPAGSLGALVMLTILSPASLLAADDASDISEAQDLTAVIALQGVACGQVISAKKQGENDFIASCQDGNRYRVFVNADGRVIVEKQ